MFDKICPSGWKRVRVLKNLGATPAVPVAPVDTFLYSKVVSVLLNVLV